MQRITWTAASTDRHHRFHGVRWRQRWEQRESEFAQHSNYPNNADESGAGHFQHERQPGVGSLHADDALILSQRNGPGWGLDQLQVGLRERNL